MCEMAHRGAGRLGHRAFFPVPTKKRVATDPQRMSAEHRAHASALPNRTLDPALPGIPRTAQNIPLSMKNDSVKSDDRWDLGGGVLRSIFHCSPCVGLDFFSIFFPFFFVVR